MTLETKRCGRCGELSFREIRVNQFGVPFWACTKCGSIQEDRSWYTEISHEEAIRVIDTREPVGLFVEKCGDKFIGVDNSTRDAWTEEFPDMCKCLRWLLNDPGYHQCEDGGKALIREILDMLPDEPRSYDIDNDPGFWTDGEEILCPSETECEAVAEFLRDILSELSTVSPHTGYYDPAEDAASNEQDDHTGFYYIDFD